MRSPVPHATGWFHVGLHTTADRAYRKGGPLAVTDANLLLGRLIPVYFPKIFGKSEKEPLDIEASRTAFEKLARQINAESGNEREMDLDEIVYGYYIFRMVLESLFERFADSLRLRMRQWPGRSVR